MTAGGSQISHNVNIKLIVYNAWKVILDHFSVKKYQMCWEAYFTRNPLSVRNFGI